MSTRRITKVLVFAGLMLVVCGCGRPNLVGTDAAVYSGSKLYAVVSQDLNSVYDATATALTQLEIEVAEKAKDVFYAKIVGAIADGQTITVRMEPGENNTTNLSISGGSVLSGNEERARTIYEKIKQNL
jgi:hypothetical protein